jgi:hypothetical protein
MGDSSPIVQESVVTFSLMLRGVSSREVILAVGSSRIWPYGPTFPNEKALLNERPETTDAARGTLHRD